MKQVNKQEIYDYLNKKGISYEVTEHKAVFSMTESDSVELPYPECCSKNLFVRDDKKKNYYLITVKGDKRVDLKNFRKTHNLRQLSFASSEELMLMMKLVPGSVSPFGLLSNEERKITFYLDQEFTGGMIGIHPNDNTATVWMKSEDLVKLIGNHGNIVNIVRIN